MNTISSRNVWKTRKNTESLGSRITSLTRSIALSVALVVGIPWIAFNSLWVTEAFSMGWQTEQKVETNQWSKLEARENATVFEDKFVSAKIVSIGEQRNKLVINLKAVPNIETIIIRSNFIQFSKIYNNALEAAWILKRTYKWKDVNIRILDVKSSSFEETARKTFKKNDFSLWNMIYMLLLQNYIQTIMFNGSYSSIIMYAENYNKACWKESSIIDCSNHSIVIKEGELMPELDSESKKRLKSERSKLLKPTFLWFEEQVLWVPYDNVYVEFMFWTENLKHALDNGFSFLVIGKLSAEKFRDIAMNTLVSWWKQIFLKIFHVLKTDSKIDYVIIIPPQNK